MTKYRIYVVVDEQNQFWIVVDNGRFIRNPTKEDLMGTKLRYYNPTNICPECRKENNITDKSILYPGNARCSEDEKGNKTREWLCYRHGYNKNNSKGLCNRNVYREMNIEILSKEEVVRVGKCKWTKDSIIEKVCDWYNKNNRPPNADELNNDPTLPDYHSMSRHFDGLYEMLDACELPYPDRTKTDLKERFEKYVERTSHPKGCHIWKGAIFNDSGYGRIQVDGKSELAHRIAYIIYHENIPDGKFVLHRCDNRLCVNDDHLFIGTHQDNMDDMVSKGRQQKGEDRYNIKLADSQINHIRIEYSKGNICEKELAEKYNVSVGLISMIVNYKYRV